MFMSKSRLFLHFFLVILLIIEPRDLSRDVYCMRVGRVKREWNNHLEFQSAVSSIFSLSAICMPLPFVCESVRSSESSQFWGEWTDRTNDFLLDAVKTSFVDV